MAKETGGKTLDPDTIRSGVRKLLNDPSKGFYLIAEDNKEPVGQLMITK